MDRDQVMGLEWDYEVGAEHLGSGAYIRPDESGSGLVLRADRDFMHHVVYLDSHAVAALERYILRFKAGQLYGARVPRPRSQA